MTILESFWHYWKSFSVWFCTAFVVLVIITTIVNYFKPSVPRVPASENCLIKGGTWDDDAKICKTAA
jgi:hypothetical protein